MLIRIEASDLPGRDCGRGPGFPGYANIHVGVQRRQRREELLGLIPGDAPSAAWELQVTPTRAECGWDLRGPFVQGSLGGRFVYLSWGTVDETGAFAMFRRAKLHLDAIPVQVLEDAVAGGVVVARLGLTDAEGQPLCAAVRPPLVEWSALSG
ncbi:MAG: monooxygenase [Streptomyces sp.]|nr:monooxygenase [Nonomuraea sp.]NUP40618.1 monooxygenase [Streptomyces sp.]